MAINFVASHYDYIPFFVLKEPSSGQPIIVIVRGLATAQFPCGIPRIPEVSRVIT